MQRIFIQLQIRKQGMHIIQGTYTAALLTRLICLIGILTGQSSLVQADIINRGTLFLFMNQQLVILLRHGQITGLGNTPRGLDITIGRCSPQKIIHTGEGILRQNILCGNPEIHRGKGNSLIGLGVHLLVKGCSL